MGFECDEIGKNERAFLKGATAAIPSFDLKTRGFNQQTIPPPLNDPNFAHHVQIIISPISNVKPITFDTKARLKQTDKAFEMLGRAADEDSFGKRFKSVCHRASVGSGARSLSVSSELRLLTAG